MRVQLSRLERGPSLLFSILSITFALLFLIIEAQSYDYKITYNESITGLTIADATADFDGTTIVCLKKPLNKQCSMNNFYLRVILPNNTVIASTFKLPLDSFDYCFNIETTVLTNGWIYLTYMRSIGNSRFAQYVLPIAYNGSRGVPMLLADFNDTLPGHIFKSMVPEAGFLYAKQVGANGPVIWKRCTV